MEGRNSIPWIFPQPLIRTLWYCVLSKVASSTIFRIFGIETRFRIFGIETRFRIFGIETRSLGPLENSLLIRPISILKEKMVKFIEYRSIFPLQQNESKK